MGERPPVPKRPLRRVPENSRKRTAKSCDLCRKRRCKCVPLPSGQGCVLCQHQRVECSYKLPRRTRFYGSVDDLSDRYKCYEAIVRQAFPDDATNNVSDLVALGHRMGYRMPDLTSGTQEPVQLKELVKTPSAGSSSANDRLSIASAANGEGSSPRGTGTTAEEPLSLIRDTAGREHFIGPSGSLQFLGQLRRLLLYSKANKGGVGTPTPTRLEAAFTDDDVAQALEADDNQTGLEGNISSMSPGTAITDHGSQQQIDEPLPATTNEQIDLGFFTPDNNEAILGQLPPRAVTDALLCKYFMQDHPDFPLFHRGSFEDELQVFLYRGRNTSQQQPPPPIRSNAPQQTCSNIPEPGWLGCLHMMIAFATLDPDPDVTSSVDLVRLRQHCIAFNQRLLPQLISKCNLSNVRALLLLSLYLHNHNERNAAWNLVGTAMRIAFAIGLHRGNENISHFRPMEREMRRRVFCTLYGFEQFLASSLGRPSGFYDFEHVEIVPPRVSLLDGGTDDDGDDVMRVSLDLQKILAKARILPSANEVAAGGINSGGTSRDSLVTPTLLTAAKTLENLENWRKADLLRSSLNVPLIIESESDIIGQTTEEGPRNTLEELKAVCRWQSRRRLRTALVLQLQYRYIAVFVTRSTLLQQVATAKPRDQTRGDMFRNQGVPSEHERLSVACVRHAVQLCRLVLLADSFDLINGISAMDVFYAYCGVMVLILRSIQPSLVASTTNSPAILANDEHELAIQAELLRLIASTREVLVRVDTCSTMQRFARVVATFEDGSRQVNSKSKSLAPGSGRPNQMGRDGGMMHSRDANMDDAHPDEGALHAQQEGMCVPKMGYDDYRQWQTSLLTSFDGDPGATDWMMEPVLGGNIMDSVVVDWGDIGSLLPEVWDR